MDVTLHDRQAEVFHDPHRFKVVAAGRRFGKSFLAAAILFVEGSKTTKLRSDGVLVDLALEEVYYVAPTFEQGKKIMWPLLKKLGEGLIAQKYENTGELVLVNGRRISIKGSDRPDTLRGVGLSYVVMDEYAFMKEEVWEMILLPALARTAGGALFIGTPDGKNHFYEKYQDGLVLKDGEWKSWHFVSAENPHLPISEIDSAKHRMTAARYRQEFEAAFEAGGGTTLDRDRIEIVYKVPEDCFRYIAVDLAGFESVEGGRKLAKLDDHAIAVVAVHSNGWLIEDIIFGKWDVRETALRIVKSFRDYRPMALGIEKGMASNAVLPYLVDEQTRLNTYFEPELLSHGNQKKTDRIVWALQGRIEKGRLQILKGDWNRAFLEQCTYFPSPLAHDDLIDAVAYIDQLADPWFGTDSVVSTWRPLDEIAGY